jgi:tetratricopeptide (TPR) repeat protein
LWEQIAGMNAKDPATQVQVAEIFRRHDMNADAERHFASAVELSPEVGQYREYFGEFLVKAGRREQAAAVFAGMAEGPRRGIDTLMRLAEVLNGFEFDEQALAASREAVAAGPESFQARMQLVKLLTHQSELDEALTQLDDAAKLAPNAYFAESVVDQRISLLNRAGRLEETLTARASALSCLHLVHPELADPFATVRAEAIRTLDPEIPYPAGEDI